MLHFVTFYRKRARVEVECSEAKRSCCLPCTSSLIWKPVCSLIATKLVLLPLERLFPCELLKQTALEPSRGAFIVPYFLFFSPSSLVPRKIIIPIVSETGASVLFPFQCPSSAYIIARLLPQYFPLPVHSQQQGWIGECRRAEEGLRTNGLFYLQIASALLCDNSKLELCN